MDRVNLRGLIDKDYRAVSASCNFGPLTLGDRNGTAASFVCFPFKK